MVGAKPQRRQGQSQSGADLAAGGRDQWRQAGDVFFGETGRQRIAGRGPQTGQHRPSRRNARCVGLEAGLSACQKHHTAKADGQTHRARQAGLVTQPNPGHDRAKQGHGGVQNGRKTCGDVHHRKRIQRERHAAVEHTHKQHGFPVLTQLSPMAFGQHQGQQKNRGNGDPNGGCRQRAQLQGCHTHEQK